MARRTSETVALVCVVLATLLVPSGASAAACAGASAVPEGRSTAAIRRATVCLINQERAARDLRKVRENRKLRRAALRHSRDMVANRYFDHVAPDGGTLVTRVRRARYIRPGTAWYLAENIAWGPGEHATPATIVESWMASTPHRANILSAEARDVGLGIALGSPRGGRGLTYTVDFGRVG